MWSSSGCWYAEHSATREHILSKKNIKIALLGLGKTGRLVADEVMDAEKYDLLWIVKHSRKKCRYVRDDVKIPVLYAEKAGRLGVDEICQSYGKPDVMLDFSSSDAIDFVIKCLKSKIRLVSSITDYSSAELKRLKRASRYSAVLHSPNITMGINFLMMAAKILYEAIGSLDINIIEEHFKEKKQISGTAKKIAQQLNISKNKIHKVRSGGIIGRHEVIFGLPNQTIRIIHESNSRKAFAQGALLGTNIVIHHNKGIHHIEDIFK